MTTISLTEQLAAQLIAWRSEGLPDETTEAAAYYFTDWLGSAIAGSVTEAGQMLLDYGCSQPNGDCTIIESKKFVSAEVAALINGGLSHIVEMDDLDRASVVHPATVVIPAALAMAERTGASGRDLFNAITIGYEVSIRVGEAVGKEHYRYFHNTATCGIFGAAAAAGWLLDLRAEQFVWAFGNAGTQAAGLWQFNRDGDMSKHLHAGMAASHGLAAADLAARGFTGARHILEGDRGFFAATAPDAEPTLVCHKLGTAPFKIFGVSIKPHASCRHTHPAIDAALAIRQKLGDGKISACRIDTYQAAINLCDNVNPQTPYAAKFSLHYCVAAALLTGEAGLQSFTPEQIQSTAVQQLLARTSVTLNAKYEKRYPVQWATRVGVKLADGSTLTDEVTHPKGDPENALSLGELEGKFRQIAAVGTDAPDAWLAWIHTLQDAANVRLTLSTEHHQRNALHDSSAMM